MKKNRRCDAGKRSLSLFLTEDTNRNIAFAGEPCAFIDFVPHQRFTGLFRLLDHQLTTKSWQQLLQPRTVRLKVSHLKL